MVRKVCPECSLPSYSAGDSYQWICPHCKTDITNEPAHPIWEEEKAWNTQTGSCSLDTYTRNTPVYR